MKDLLDLQATASSGAITMLTELKETVWQANLDLVRHGLVILTFGNASGIDRDRGIVAIKPSGVSYDDMKPEDMVLVDLDGKTVEGTLNPSSDTPTHVELYKSFPDVGGIVHAHSEYATMFAQAAREIPCLGTTHADHFHGPVPVTRFLPRRKSKRTTRAIRAGSSPTAFPGWCPSRSRRCSSPATDRSPGENRPKTPPGTRWSWKKRPKWPWAP